MTQQRVNPFESKWVAYFGGQLLTLATGEKWLTVSSVVLSILGQCDLLWLLGVCVMFELVVFVTLGFQIQCVGGIEINLED